MKFVSCLLTFLFGLLLSAMLGCDDGTYESRYNERLQNSPAPAKKADDADKNADADQNQDGGGQDGGDGNKQGGNQQGGGKQGGGRGKSR